MLDYLAENDFKIVYRAGKDNGAAHYLSRNVHGDEVGMHEDKEDLVCLAFDTLQFGELEPYNANSARYLCGLPTEEKDAHICRAIRRNAEQFLVWDEKPFKVIDKCLQVVSDVHRRQGIIKSFHEDIGHLDVKATQKLITERFCWATMYRKIGDYVNTCDECQRLAPLPKYCCSLFSATPASRITPEGVRVLPLTS